MPPTVELLVVRHAESEGNREGSFGGHGPTPLSEEGHRQAQHLARALVAENAEVAHWTVWASDLPRATQTAAPLCERLGVPLRTTPALRERDVGVFTGLSFTEAARLYPEAYARLVARDPEPAIPGAEHPHDCATRAADHCLTALSELAELSHERARLVLVSHSYAINLMLRRLLRISDGAPEIFFQTDNTAIHRIRISPRGTWTLQAINDRRHLE